YVLLRLLRSEGWLEYAVLGLLLGLGTLSKYNYLLFGGALFLAGLMTRPLRERLLSRRLVLTLAIAGAVVLPHGLVLVNHLDRLAAIKTKACSGPPSLGALARGGKCLASIVFLSVVPLLSLGLIFFRQRPCLTEYPKNLAAPGQQFLERYFLTASCLLLAL